MKINIILLIVFIFATSTLRADVYKWVDENGNVHYSDKSTNQKTEKIIIDDVSIRERAIPKDSSNPNRPRVNFRVELTGFIGSEKQYDAFAVLTKDQPEVAGRVLMNYRHMKKVMPLQARFKVKDGKYLIQKDVIDHPEWITLDAILDLDTRKLKGTLFHIDGDKKFPVNVDLKVSKISRYDSDNKPTSTTNNSISTILQKKIDASKSKIISWSIHEESDEHIMLKINYFYDGLFEDAQLWISASSIEPGAFVGYSVRPVKISKGYNSALVNLGVSSKAKRNFCTSKLEFSIYGKINGGTTKTFITSLVDHKKCWKNNNFNSKKSNPIRVNDANE